MVTKIKVLIVDDEPLARRGLRQLLEPEVDFEIVGEARNGREAVSAVGRLTPDLVFLDIQMPLLDGFSFLEQIIGKEVPEIVFVTAYDEHAIRAFEAGAIDYLLKPVDPDRFHKTLDRARSRILARDTGSLEQRLSSLVSNLRQPALNYLSRIAVKTNDRIRFLPVEQIEWISSQGNYIQIHSGAEKFLIREPMNGIERKLDPHDFLRIRRSAIVRIDQIRELHPLFVGELEVILKSGVKLTSSRRYRRNLDALLKI
ncbi:MAG TPA: response regulator [Pyrinomonadaceae bacterium]|nr:response regulator [Pyrinomonadaceae bacterium]